MNTQGMHWRCTAGHSWNAIFLITPVTNNLMGLIVQKNVSSGIQVLCVTNRAVVLLACSSVLSLVLYFCGFSIFVEFFMFHADCFFFFILVTDLRHLTVKNSFLYPFLVFHSLSKPVLYSNPGGSLFHFALNSNWTATHCKRKTWWPSFKWLQCFDLAVLDGGLIAGGLQWEVLALSRHTCHPAAPRCRLLLVISAGLAFVFCLGCFPKSNSITKTAPVINFSPWVPALGAAEGAGLVKDLPDALPIPLLRPCLTSAPLQTWRVSPSCSCLGCVTSQALLWACMETPRH